MTFEWNTSMKPFIFRGRPNFISIDNGKCMVDGKVVGSKCVNITEGKKLELMVDDVTIGESLGNTANANPISFAPFVPYCDFQQPKENHVDFETSFPFSRFVGGSQDVELKFAVGGANHDGEVTLVRNELTIGEWKGIKYTNGSINVNLTVDVTKNLRVLTYKFSKENDRDAYFWETAENFLVVNVDWTQTGDSPELDECKKYPKPPSSN
ncbi:unnamed protein product, partial [Hymenolepis diminuta]